MYLRVKDKTHGVRPAQDFALSFIYLWRATIAACSFSFSAWVIPRNCQAYKKQLRSTLQEEADSLLCFRSLHAEQPVSDARVLQKGKRSQAFLYAKALRTSGSRSSAITDKFSVFTLLRPTETFECLRFHGVRVLQLKDKYIKVRICEEKGWYITQKCS